MKIQEVHSSTYLEEAQKKIKNITDIAPLAQGKCIFTKGVFDLLHFGHLSLFSYLEHLKLESDGVIVVGVAADSLVKKKKGDKRPINPENERALQIALLPQVDYVFINSHADLSTCITLLKPKYFIKGVDTTIGGMGESSLLEKNEELKSLDPVSTFVIYKDDQSISTSNIIERIIEKN